MRTPRKVRDHLKLRARQSRVLRAALEYADAVANAEDRLDSEEDPVVRTALVSTVQTCSSAMERAAVALREVVPRRRRRRRA
jgi:hypothetical protein